jgi:cell division protein FtsI/penicillin-binding protein 2
VYPERGSIYDRWGNLLAGNKTVYELGIDVNAVVNPESIAITLATVYPKLQYADVFQAAAEKKLNPNTKQVYILLDSSVPSDVIDKLSAIDKQYNTDNPYGGKKNLPTLVGLVWTDHLQRTYPEKSLAANLIGYFSLNPKDMSGHEGVEGRYNDLLAGRPVTISIPKDPYKIQSIPEVPPGANLILTIDREMQSATERILDAAMQKNGAVTGTIVVEDPRTGEILAMATSPRIDPNEYWNFGNILPKGASYNNAVSSTYEPGSVFKVLTMAAALDSGAVTPDTHFMDTGSYNVDGVDITNWDLGAWGDQDMTGCLEHSLNVCLAWIGVEKIGPTRFYQYIDAFGIGHLTNVDLSGEVNYPVLTPGSTNWHKINLATNAFGQGVSVTPIQMIQAVSAVANNGRMMLPHILKSYVQDGVQYPVSPLLVGTPISAKTAQTLSEMLANSLEGESSVALVPGYRVAGKTGTASIAENGRYLNNVTNASFVGWGPVDDPRFLIYIWFERPKSDIWGSVVASPVFSEVFTELARIAQLPPDDIRRQLKSQ